MILTDTGAIYALTDTSDLHHASAADWYNSLDPHDGFLATTTLIVSESWYLVNKRKGAYYADKLVELLLDGTFEILDVTESDLAEAFQIRKKYGDSGIGFVDATSLAVCERRRISQVFTFDRTHFGIYRPRFTGALELLPSS